MPYGRGVLRGEVRREASKCFGQALVDCGGELSLAQLAQICVVVEEYDGSRSPAVIRGALGVEPEDVGAVADLRGGAGDAGQ